MIFVLNKYSCHSCENRVMQSSSRVFLLFSVAICVLPYFCEGGAPQTPLTQPYYPYEVPKGTYPCDWPGLKNSSDPASGWAGNDYQHMRVTAPQLQNWPGLGYVAWIGLANNTKGDQVVSVYVVVGPLLISVDAALSMFLFIQSGGQSVGNQVGRTALRIQLRPHHPNNDLTLRQDSSICPRWLRAGQV